METLQPRELEQALRHIAKQTVNVGAENQARIDWIKTHPTAPIAVTLPVKDIQVLTKLLMVVVTRAMAADDRATARECLDIAGTLYAALGLDKDKAVVDTKKVDALLNGKGSED